MHRQQGVWIKACLVPTPMCRIRNLLGLCASFDGCALSVPPAPVQAQNSVVSNRSRIRSGSFPTIA